jgi:DNA ligase (NAD+)
MNNVKQIVKKLHEAQDAYYNSEAIMSDDEYDKLEEQLRVLDSKNAYFKKVGAKVVGKNKIKHKIPMLSTDKAKTVDEVKKWLDKINANVEVIIVESKIDGLSLTIKYVDGKMQYLSTRGDGKEGECKTKYAKYLSIPDTISLMGEIEIRGEIVLYKNHTINNPENNLERNIAAGIINRKEGFEKDAEQLHFISYQIIGSDFKKETDKLDWLKKNGFEVAEYKICSGIKALEQYYNKYEQELREMWRYSTDGLVLVINNCELHDEIDSKYTIDKFHRYCIAWKPASKSEKTILKDIEWQVSRSGSLIPVAILDPVKVGGALISRASLSNYETVVRMKLEKGDEVEIARSNDVIPYVSINITKNIKQKKE